MQLTQLVCKNCGEKIIEDEAVCMKCGADIEF